MQLRLSSPTQWKSWLSYALEYASGVTGEGGGANRPGWHPPGGWQPNEIKNVAEFRKNTGQARSKGGSCDETTAKIGDD